LARIVLVEDNPVLAELLSEALEHAGHRVRTAGGGGEALKALGVEPPGPCGADLALIDVHLPDMGGVELAERLKGGSGTAALQVVFLTGDAEAQLPEGARWLRKPFGMDKVIELIRELGL